MEKTTLYLETTAYRKLKRIAAGEKRAPAALVREAVAEYVARRASHALPSSVGAFGSGRRDLSERVEELLAGIGEHRPRRGGRGRR